jgi:hypothetical protein
MDIKQQIDDIMVQIKGQPEHRLIGAGIILLGLIFLIIGLLLW